MVQCVAQSGVDTGFLALSLIVVIAAFFLSLKPKWEFHGRPDKLSTNLLRVLLIFYFLFCVFLIAFFGTLLSSRDHCGAGLSIKTIRAIIVVDLIGDFWFLIFQFCSAAIVIRFSENLLDARIKTKEDNAARALKRIVVTAGVIVLSVLALLYLITWALNAYYEIDEYFPEKIPSTSANNAHTAFVIISNVVYFGIIGTAAVAMMISFKGMQSAGNNLVIMLFAIVLIFLLAENIRELVQVVVEVADPKENTTTTSFSIIMAILQIVFSDIYLIGIAYLARQPPFQLKLNAQNALRAQNGEKPEQQRLYEEPPYQQQGHAGQTYTDYKQQQHQQQGPVEMSPEPRKERPQELPSDAAIGELDSSPNNKYTSGVEQQQHSHGTRQKR